MKSVTALVVVACAAPAILAQQMMVNSLADVVQCQPAQITWQGGVPPYYLSLIPAGQPLAPPLKQFDQQNGNSVTWTVDLPANTAFTTELKDSTGAVVYSGEQTIMEGSSGGSCASGSVSAPALIASTSASGTSSMSSTATSSGISIQVPSASTSPSSVSVSGSGSAAVPLRSASASTSHTSGSAMPSATQSTHSSAGRGYAAFGVVGLTGFLGLLGFAML
ncbi:hypothetical protein BDY19DRAFT_756569 [Irpex rosettiformis]|uniref:Uncharacterized protein n=1 Tax=Irpex rosettiformis TaxID=378272 RepID=A0ACB8U708_9APHY|nr:hypothetical protein BDY19DRAFT_756569 [Irpex rosettiformis]